MPCCSALNCSNQHADGVRLFRWPAAAGRAALWLANCGRGSDGWRPNSSSRLCEIHFDPTQFEERRQDGWRKLKPNAVPTLFGTAEKGSLQMMNAHEGTNSMGRKTSKTKKTNGGIVTVTAIAPGEAKRAKRCMGIHECEGNYARN